MEKQQGGRRNQDAASSAKLGEMKKRAVRPPLPFRYTLAHQCPMPSQQEHCAGSKPQWIGRLESAKRKFNKKKKEDDEQSSESDTDEAIQKESKMQQRKSGSKNGCESHFPSYPVSLENKAGFSEN